MRPERGRRRKPKIYDSPEKQKNGRNRRRILLNKGETGKKWRYGISGGREVDGSN
jgi:hypothetical protein